MVLLMGFRFKLIKATGNGKRVTRGNGKSELVDTVVQREVYTGTYNMCDPFEDPQRLRFTADLYDIHIEDLNDAGGTQKSIHYTGGAVPCEMYMVGVEQTEPVGICLAGEDIDSVDLQLPATLPRTVDMSHLLGMKLVLAQLAEDAQLELVQPELEFLQNNALWVAFSSDI